MRVGCLSNRLCHQGGRASPCAWAMGLATIRDWRMVSRLPVRVGAGQGQSQPWRL